MQNYLARKELILVRSYITCSCFPYYVLVLYKALSFPNLINRTSPFPFLGWLGGIFHFYSIFLRNFCKQTVENLIRRVMASDLVLRCFCRCTTKMTLVLIGLTSSVNRINSGQADFGTYLHLNCLMVFMKQFFEEVDLKKISSHPYQLLNDFSKSLLDS